jgi:hypothetical protein
MVRRNTARPRFVDSDTVGCNRDSGDGLFDPALFPTLMVYGCCLSISDHLASLEWYTSQESIALFGGRGGRVDAGGILTSLARESVKPPFLPRSLQWLRSR